MKKILVIGAIAVAFVAVLALGVTSWAYAQDDQPVFPYNGENGWMGRGGGMHGWASSGEYGPMHEYMFPAMAEAFGLTEAELQAAHDEGKTLWDIAQEQGKTYEEFYALMQAARTQAFEQMVGDGVISQEQADWMLQHMNGAGAGGYGPGTMGAGGCTGTQTGSFGMGMRGGGRWATQP